MRHDVSEPNARSAGARPAEHVRDHLLDVSVCLRSKPVQRMVRGRTSAIDRAANKGRVVRQQFIDTRGGQTCAVAVQSPFQPKPARDRGKRPEILVYGRLAASRKGHAETTGGAEFGCKSLPQLD